MSRLRIGLAALFVVAVSAVSIGPAQAQRFYPDDPMWEDPDRMDMPVPEPRSASESFDPIGFLARTFGQPGTHSGPAVNVNTLGEVPNSSWYTNRHYHDRLSIDALRQGPNHAAPPDTSAPWTVTAVTQVDGLPRATVRDAEGRSFHLLVDDEDHPELATGAGMTASRLLYALGYNVPAHYLLRIRPDRLVPAADTTVGPADVARIARAAPVGADGTVRALLTRIPEAEKNLGPFTFYGTRADDANDIFPHEARRELRGLRVVAAWINHSKVQRSRTRDVLVEEDGRTFVRHYLIGLQSTFGSGGAAPKEKWSGHEHILELRAVLTRIGTLGFSGGDWMEATTPDLRGVGHFEASYFQPRDWRPETPNPAFERADSTDAFWAARQVAHFTPDELAAMVGTAAYSDTSTHRYLVQTLRRRQQAIAAAYLDHGGGLDRFRVDNRELRFDDLRARHDLAPDSVRRQVTWHVFDNDANRVTDRLRVTTSAGETLPLPLRSPPFLRVRLLTPGEGSTRVYLRRTPTRSYEVVGIDRHGP